MDKAISFMFQENVNNPYIAVSAGADPKTCPINQRAKKQIKGVEQRRNSTNQAKRDISPIDTSFAGNADFTIDRNSLSPRFKRALLPRSMQPSAK